MDLLEILLIVAGAVILLIVIFLVVGKVSASKKRIINKDLAKKLGKAKGEAAKSFGKPQEKKDEFDLTPASKPIVQEVKSDSSKKSADAVVEELDESDREFLGLSENASMAKPEEAPKRKSIEEIIRARQASKAQEAVPKTVDEDDEEFDEFRRQHSSFIPYKKDNALIEEIKNLSPEMKAIVFNNLFNHIDHDKF